MNSMQNTFKKLNDVFDPNLDLEDILIKTKRKTQLPRFAISVTQNILSTKLTYQYDILKVLDLSHNRLDQLPENIKHFKNLKSLNLSDNFIKILQSEILEPLIELDTLILRNNLISSFIILDHWSRKLRILDLSQNHIKSIPYQIGDLNQLTQLYLAHNNFYFLPYQFMYLNDSLNLFQLDWFKYSKYPLNDLISDQAQLDDLFKTLKEIFFSSVLIANNTVEEDMEGIHFKILINNEKYLSYAKRYYKQENLSQFFDQSMDEENINEEEKDRQINNNRIQFYTPSEISQNRSSNDVFTKENKTSIHSSRKKSNSQAQFGEEEKSNIIQEEPDGLSKHTNYASKTRSIIKNNKKNKMHLAVLNEDIGVLRCLIKEDVKKQQINQIDNEFQTPLSVAIAEEKYLAAKYILFNNADPNLGGGLLGGCLNLAISKLQYFLVQDLIKHGADIQKNDQFLNSPMHYLFTVFSSNPNEASEIGRLLINNGAKTNDRNIKGYTPIHLAIKKGNLLAIQFAILHNKQALLTKQKQFSFKQKCVKDKNTCLHMAVQTKHLKIVQIVFEQQKEQIFQRNIYDLIPLDYLKDDLTIFKYLLHESHKYISMHFKISKQKLYFHQSSSDIDNENLVEQSIVFTTIDELPYLQNQRDSQLQQTEFENQKSLLSNPVQKYESHSSQIRNEFAPRSIHITPNNITLLEKQSRLFTISKSNQTTFDVSKQLQIQTRIVKQISNNMLQFLQNQDTINENSKDEQCLADKIADIFVYKKINIMIRQLSTILQSDIINLQWQKYVVYQNDTWKKQDNRQRVFSVELQQQFDALSKSQKQGPFSFNIVKHIINQNRIIENSFTRFYLEPSKSDKALIKDSISSLGKQFNHTFSSNNQFNKYLLIYENQTYNNYLCNYFLSPHNGFGLQRLIIFLNNTENNKFILGSQNSMLNQYDLMQIKNFITEVPQKYYCIINQKLLLKIFLEDTIVEKQQQSNKDYQ